MIRLLFTGAPGVLCRMAGGRCLSVSGGGLEFESRGLVWWVWLLLVGWTGWLLLVGVLAG